MKNNTRIWNCMCTLVQIVTNTFHIQFKKKLAFLPYTGQTICWMVRINGIERFVFRKKCCLVLRKMHFLMFRKFSAWCFEKFIGCVVILYINTFIFYLHQHIYPINTSMKHRLLKPRPSGHTLRNISGTFLELSKKVLGSFWYTPHF